MYQVSSVETHSHWATLEGFHNFSVIFNYEGSVLLVIKMSSPHSEISVHFLEPAYFQKVFQRTGSPLWGLATTTGFCTSSPQVSSRQLLVIPILWVSPPQGLHAQATLVSLPLRRRNPRGCSILSASLCYHALPPQYFFSPSLLVVGQDHKPRSSANIPSMEGNTFLFLSHSL